MYQEILYEVEDPVATITLNRPEKLNALTSRTLQEVKHALAEAERSEAVVGIVITGAGRGFCGGLDLGALSQVQAAGAVAAINTATEFDAADPGDESMKPEFDSGFGYLLTVRKPIIAAVNGPAAGLGFALSMFCDMRFASEQAVFTTAYAQRGLVAESGMSWVLPRLLGTARALDILWSARRFDATEALQLGVVNRVVQPEQLLPEAQGYIRTLAATCAPRSLMQMKQQVYSELLMSFREAMRASQHRVDASVAGPDLQEGIDSFKERRLPRFGRVTLE